MHSSYLTALQLNNLHNLSSLWEACRRYEAQAAQVFGVPTDAVPAYAALSPEEVMGLALQLDVSVVVPRLSAAELAAFPPCMVVGLSMFDRSSVQNLNVLNLQALRDACRQSQGEAAWAYHIDAAEAQAYAALSDDMLLAASTRLEVFAFAPRYGRQELATLSGEPAALAGLFSAVFEQAVH